MLTLFPSLAVSLVSVMFPNLKSTQLGEQAILSVGSGKTLAAQKSVQSVHPLSDLQWANQASEELLFLILLLLRLSL